MKSTLTTIQKISKAGKILSRIVFIFCIIGGAGCILGIIGLAVVPEELKIFGVTVHNIVEKSAETTLGTAYTSLAVGLVFCAGETVLSKIAERYFKHELAAGTPFTFDGARELKRLGICTICIPFGTALLSSIVYSIMKRVFDSVAEVKLAGSVSIGLGIMFIVTSVICRYGAELSSGGANGVDR